MHLSDIEISECCQSEPASLFRQRIDWLEGVMWRRQTLGNVTGYGAQPALCGSRQRDP